MSNDDVAVGLIAAVVLKNIDHNQTAPFHGYMPSPLACFIFAIGATLFIIKFF